MTAQLCKFPQPKKAERPKHWSDSISIAKDYGLKHGYVTTLIEELMPMLPENIRMQFTLDDQDGSEFYGCARGAFVALSLEIGKRAMLALHEAHMRSFRLDIADDEQHALQDQIYHFKSILISALRDFAYFGGGQQLSVGTEETFRRAFFEDYIMADHGELMAYRDQHVYRISPFHPSYQTFRKSRDRFVKREHYFKDSDDILLTTTGYDLLVDAEYEAWLIGEGA